MTETHKNGPVGKNDDLVTKEASGVPVRKNVPLRMTVNFAIKYTTQRIS